MNKAAKFIALTVTLMLAGCSSQNDEDPLAIAKGYIDSRDFNSAIITLKNYLVENPDNNEFRALLAESYFQLGLYPEAESAYLKSIRESQNNEKTKRRLAEIYYLTNNKKSLKDLYDKNITNLNEEIVLFHALQLLDTGDKKAAKEKIHRLATFNTMPNTVYLLNKTLNQEKMEANTSQKKEHDYENILIARLYSSNKNNTAAIDSYNIFLGKYPKNHKFNYEKAVVNILDGSIKEAKNTLNKLPSSIQKSEAVQTLFSYINFSDGFYEQAKINAENALIQNKQNPQAKMLLAFISYKLGLDEQAFELLSKLQNSVFESPQTLALVSSILLDSKTHEDSEISKLLSSAAKNYEAVRFLTTFIVEQKGSEDALTIFNRSLKENPNNPKLLETSGYLKIQKNLLKEGYSDIEKALAIDPGLEIAAGLLSRYRLEQGNTLGALDIAKSLKNTANKQNEGFLLEGQLYLILKDQNKAMSSLQKVLSNTPEYAKAQQVIASIYQANNKTNKSIESLFESITANPQSLAPYSQIIDIYKKQKNKKIYNFFEKNSTNFNSLGFILAYSDILLLNSENSSSIKVLNNAESRFKNNYSFYIFKAKKEYYLTSQEDAFNSLVKAVKLKPTAMAAWDGLFNIQKIDNDNIDKKISRLIDEEITAQSDKNTVLSSYARSLIKYNKTTKAKNIIDSLPESLDKPDQNNVLLGLYHQKTNNLDKARELFKKAYLSNASESNAILYAGVLRETNGVQAAQNLLSNHIKEHSSSPLLEIIISQYNIEKDPEAALKQNRKLLASNPNNPALLNNGAWLETKYGDKALGLTLAKKAAKLLPNHPTIMDTLASSFMANNQKQLALDIWAQLIPHIPANNNIRLHYAKALLSAGRTVEAKTIFQGYEPEETNTPPAYEELELKLKTL